MDIKNEIFDMLTRARGFIYAIDGNYYLLGNSVFRKCNESEIEIYQQYISELERIHGLTYQIESRDVRQLILLLDKILEAGNQEFCLKNENPVKHKLYELLRKMDESTLKSIKKQRESYIEALNYKDRALIETKAK